MVARLRGGISILLPDLRGGGAERVGVDLAHEFRKAGSDVDFVLMRACGPLLSEVRAFFTVADLGISRARELLLPFVRYLRCRGPEAILVSMWPLTVIAPWAVRLSGLPCKVLISEHNMLSEQYRDKGCFHQNVLRASMALGYRLADHRVGVSAGVVQDIAQLSGLSTEAFTVIHNPVSPRPEPSPATIREAEALWSGPPGARIVTVGSMKAQKNHPLLLQAFARLDQPDARLMFVGDGAGREALLSLARELDVANRVILTGFCPDPTPFYKTADLFALSSDYEGFGNVIVEAMACGTPVVSTDCPSGPSEILDGGRYGRLVPVGDVAAMAKGLQAALDDRTPEQILLNRALDFQPKRAADAYLKLMSGM